MKTDLTELELEELSRLIHEGNTSGRIDRESEDGKTRCVSWELKTEIWEE